MIAYEKFRTRNIHRVEHTNVSPHSDTQRFTTTIAAENKALLAYVMLRVERRTAATTAGVAAIYMTCVPYDGTETLIARAALTGNTVGTAAGVNVGMNVLLLPGDVLRVYTSDSSTGGTCDYWASIHVIGWR